MAADVLVAELSASVPAHGLRWIKRRHRLHRHGASTHRHGPLKPAAGRQGARLWRRGTLHRRRTTMRDMSRLHAITAPGQAQPGVGFEQPFEMLAACHDRVRQSLALLARLLAHWQMHGADTAARSAAADVWRYFEIAAPQHHLDEERHVVPRLQASTDPALQAAAARLLADHGLFQGLWLRLGPALQALRDGAEPAPGWMDDARAFIDRHQGPDGHLALEDGLVFPAARRATPEADWPAMGAEMAARRRPPA